MLWVIDIKIINVQKQQESLHGFTSVPNLSKSQEGDLNEHTLPALSGKKMSLSIFFCFW